jgi:secondary thiamine-phosphate synthase enzyme
MAAWFGTLELVTNNKAEMVDVTKRVRAEVKASGIQNGICLVASTHTTGGLTLNENTDPSVRADILGALEHAVPANAAWYVHKEDNSHAHVQASLTGFSVTLPVQGGKLVLGTWQAIYFCEFDGPRSRKLSVTVVG